MAFGGGRRVRAHVWLVICVMAFLAASTVLVVWAPSHLALVGREGLPYEASTAESEQHAAAATPDTVGLPREVWAGGGNLDRGPELAAEVRRAAPPAAARGAGSRRPLACSEPARRPSSAPLARLS
jgi:hypothetical protein